MIFLHFYKVNILFPHQSYLKSSLPVKLCKNNFLLLKKFKNTESAQLCSQLVPWLVLTRRQLGRVKFFAASKSFVKKVFCQKSLLFVLSCLFVFSEFFRKMINSQLYLLGTLARSVIVYIICIGQKLKPVQKLTISCHISKSSLYMERSWR